MVVIEEDLQGLLWKSQISELSGFDLRHPDVLQ